MITVGDRLLFKFSRRIFYGDEKRIKRKGMLANPQENHREDRLTQKLLWKWYHTLMPLHHQTFDKFFNLTI